MIILNYYGVPFLLRGLAKPGRAIRYIFLKGTSRPQFPFKKDVATIPNAGAITITISISKINIRYSILFIYLNFLMVHKSYIPLYFLYGSITISKFVVQNSLFNIHSSSFTLIS